MTQACACGAPPPAPRASRCEGCHRAHKAALSSVRRSRLQGTTCCICGQATGLRRAAYCAPHRPKAAPGPRRQPRQCAGCELLAGAWVEKDKLPTQRAKTAVGWSEVVLDGEGLCQICRWERSHGDRMALNWEAAHDGLLALAWMVAGSPALMEAGM